MSDPCGNVNGIDIPWFHVKRLNSQTVQNTRYRSQILQSRSSATVPEVEDDRKCKRRRRREDGTRAHSNQHWNRTDSSTSDFHVILLSGQSFSTTFSMIRGHVGEAAPEVGLGNRLNLPLTDRSANTCPFIRLSSWTPWEHYTPLRLRSSSIPVGS